MKFIETGDPDILQTRGGGGLALIFGIVFLFTGILIIALAFESPGYPPWYVPVAFGSVFLIIGTALTFGRTGTIIDRRKRTVLDWYGLMIPMKRKTYQLQYYNQVVLKKDLRQSEHSSYYAYPVCLRGSGGSKKDLVISDPEDYSEGRSSAEKIAAFLKFPLVDITSGEETVRESHELDKPFREREKQVQRPVFTSSLSPPPGMKSLIKEKGDELFIYIPPTKISLQDAKRAFALAIICIIVFFIVNGGLSLESLKPEKFITYIPVIIIFILISIRPLLKLSKDSWKIYLNKNILQVEKTHKGKKELSEIHLNKLEDFLFGDAQSMKAHTPKSSYVRKKEQVSGFQFLTSLFVPFPSKGITARSDKTSIHLGRGVDEKEMLYIYEIMKRKICEE